MYGSHFPGHPYWYNFCPSNTLLQVFFHCQDIVSKSLHILQLLPDFFLEGGGALQFPHIGIHIE